MTTRSAAIRSVVLVGVLKGSFMFVSDLARRLTIPHYIDFMAVSSYGSYAVSGAQEPEYFFPLFDLVTTKQAAAE